jgi:uncharacterized protein (DUF58 family)
VPQSTPSFAQGTLRNPKLAAALKTLELTVRRKLDGQLHGDHLGLLPGPGSEPGDSRTYVPGDDVRQMDWSVTARTTHPHVRQMVADRELETWIVVDLSASMDFGTANCEKRDLAVAAASAIVHLTTAPGNRHGAIIATGSDIVRVNARSGRQHIQNLLSTIATTPKSADGERGNLAAAIDSLRRPLRRKGLAVVISDFLGPVDWDRPLRGIGARHELLGVEVLDPRDLELPAVGEVVLRDAESGQINSYRITESLRARFAEAAKEHQSLVHRTLRSAGGGVLPLRTDKDWIGEIVRFVSARRRGLVNGAA